ncbi:hypothetical protein [Microvirga massiliensis]|uniref:hypothetical protein n=1 Tax=Microvirga massiliensis TaxID=1033741 RepID=UPI00062BB957|nr:hypothetical protein [Microvirga massiliensis]
MTSLAIHIDRLKKNLEKNGVSWKRHKILELLSSTFGYHNSNELTAAHKRGEIDPPKAEPIGEIALPSGESIVVVRDPLARAPYAIDQSFLERVVAEERAETFGPPPYGHLIDLSRLLDGNLEKIGPALKSGPGAEMVKIDVFCAVMSFRNSGESVNLYLSEDDLYSEVADLCRNDWQLRSQMGNVGEEEFDLATASDREIVRFYYRDNEREGLTIVESQLEVPASMVGALPRSGQRLNPKGTIPVRLYQAETTHRHGSDIYTEATQEALDRRVAAYCRDHWGDWRDGSDAGDDETDPQTLSDEEVTRRYFDAMEGEYVEGSFVDIEIPVAQLNLPASTRSQSRTSRGGVHPRARKQPSIKSRPDQGTAANARKAMLTQLGFKNYELNDEQRDVILAALRLWQSTGKDQIADVLMGYSCLYKGLKFVMPCAEYYFGEDSDRDQALAEVTAYATDIRTRIEAIGGYVLVDEDDGPDEDRHTVQVLVPFEHALRLVRGAKTEEPYDAWVLALIDLLLPTDMPRIQAAFRPEVWVGDQAMTVEPAGKNTWDVTAEIVQMGSERALALRDNDYPSDDLRNSRNAPDWVRDWNGPFRVEVAGAIAMFYEHLDGHGNK